VAGIASVKTLGIAELSTFRETTVQPPGSGSFQVKMRRESTGSYSSRTSKMTEEQRSWVRGIVIGLAAIFVLLVVEAFLSKAGEDSAFERHYRLLELVLSWKIIAPVVAAFLGIESIRTVRDRVAASGENPDTGRSLDVRGSKQNVEAILKAAGVIS
jgi:hypothetical protein